MGEPIKKGAPPVCVLFDEACSCLLFLVFLRTGDSLSLPMGTSSVFPCFDAAPPRGSLARRSDERFNHFVFCLAARYVVDQLQCLGILQTCEVLKVGMPTRVTYTELKEVR